MASAGYSKNDPTLLLLNEIEILLAQTRLMELYLKQAQAKSANESARTHERHQAELNALRSALAQYENRPAANRSGANDTEQQLLARVQLLENQLSDKENLLSSRERRLEGVNFDAAQLRQRVAMLEAANDQAQTDAKELARSRDELQAVLDALRHTLEGTQSEFRRRQLLAQELEENLRRQLQQAHGELAARDSRATGASAELQQARSEISALQDRVSELQANCRAMEALAARELEQRRTGFETELAALRAVLAQRDNSLQESQGAIAAIERGFKEQIQSLQTQLETTYGLIQARDAELQSAYSQGGELRQRITDLETINQRSAEELLGIRSSLESEITELQHQIEGKERELTHRYEAVAAVELALHSKIQALEEELARSRGELTERENDIHVTRGEINHLTEKIEQLQSACAEAESSGKRFVEETRQRVESELNRLHASLAQKEYALKERENAFRGLEEQLNATIDQLRGELEQQQQSAGRTNDREPNAEIDARNQELQQHLAEKQSLVESRERELESLGAEFGRLTEQLKEREAEVEELRVQSQKDLQSRRAAHQAELTLQREQSIINQQTFEKVLFQEQERATELAQRIADLERRSEETVQQLHSRERSLEVTAAEAAALRERLQELENQRHGELSKTNSELDELRANWQAELQFLRGEIERKSQALAQQQAGMEERRREFQEQIQTLEERLTERQRGEMDRSAELETSRAQADILRRRLEELETALQHAQLAAASQAEQSKRESAARSEEIDAALAQTNAAIEERNSAAARIEQTLHEELARAVRDAQERTVILHDRNDELVRVKAERDSLLEKQQILEAAASQNEAADNQDAERMHIEFQAQLAALQAELSQKEWSLEEQRAATSSMDRQYREEIETLRRQLAEQTAQLEPSSEDFFFDDTIFTPEQRQRYIKFKRLMNAEEPAADSTQSQPEGQRWRSRFGWSRRWKS